MWAEVPTLAVVGLAAILGTLGTEVVLKIVKQQIIKNIKTITEDKDNE